MTPKFRVWDTRDERMFTVKEMYFGPAGPTAVRVMGNVSISQYKKTDFLRMPRGIVMQWTGLKDKNGVEIYEGDILKTHPHEYTRPEFEAGWLFEVAWCPGNGTTVGWWLYEVESYTTFNTSPVDWSEVASNEFANTDFTPTMQNMAFEVIGNIHATPELLNATV